MRRLDEARAKKGTLDADEDALRSRCGQSRSALASQADRDQFAADHRERCGRPVEAAGFFADVVADALGLRHCANREEAYSVAEALRRGQRRP